ADMDALPIQEENEKTPFRTKSHFGEYLHRSRKSGTKTESKIQRAGIINQLNFGPKP
ncbi:MAG: hypothetical protein RL582_1249, partial [Bacteroidota bacterium]